MCNGNSKDKHFDVHGSQLYSIILEHKLLDDHGSQLVGSELAIILVGEL